MPEEQKIACVVTRYSLQLGADYGQGAHASHQLVESTERETTSYRVERGWLFLGNSAASASVQALLDRARAGEGWCAQSGTRPVRVDGLWGGKNYPEIWVSAEELLRVLEDNRG